MKIRSDSPFAKLSREDLALLLQFADAAESMEELADKVELEFQIEVTTDAVRKFIKRLRNAQTIEAAKDGHGDLEELAELGRKSTSRDAVLELARQKLLEVTENTAEADKLAEVVRTLSEEKAREHELGMRERAMKVAEENARLGWRKMELLEARSAMKLLPQITAILMEENGTAEERLRQAREVLGAGGGRLLALAEGQMTRAQMTKE